MKTIGTIVTTLTLALTVSVSAAFAQSQTTTDNVANYFPADTEILYELDFSQDNFIKDLVMFSMGVNAANADTDLERDAMQLLMDIMEDSRFSMSMSSADNPEVIFIASISSEQAAKVQEVQENLLHSDKYTLETYQGKQLVVSNNGTTFLLYNEKFIFASSPEEVKAVVDVIMGNAPSLASNASYKNVTQDSLENTFLHMYINLQAITQGVLQNSMESFMFEIIPGTAEIVKAESLQISQYSEGFKGLVSVEGNQDVMKKANWTFNKYDFVPSMYKEVTGENILLYAEFNNLQGMLNDFASIAENNAWKDQIKEETGVNVDKEVLPLMSGKGALAIHKAQGSVYPGLTLYFDVSGNLNAANMLTALNLKLKETWEEQYTEDEYQYRIDTINGIAFYTHAFLMPEEALAQEVPLRMAIKNNTLTISIHPNLEQLLQGSSMAQNSAFMELFTNPEQRVSDLQYISFEGIRSYFLSVKDILESSEGDYENAAEIMDTIAQILRPWKDSFGTTTSEPYLATGRGTIRVDVNGFDQYPALFQKLTKELTAAFSGPYANYYSPQTYLPGSTTFCDVKSEDWYYSAVTSLASSKVIKGYSDGCFHPEYDITRAEFLKMVMEQYARQEDYSMQYQTNDSQSFSDVSSNAWFASYVNAAVKAGYVQGYSNGTFKPNATITRAEAVQILYSFKGKPEMPESSSLSFRDVQKSDWFYSAVLWAKNMSIAQGTTTFTFEPNRNLNRAEAAALVDKTW